MLSHLILIRPENEEALKRRNIIHKIQIILYFMSNVNTVTSNHIHIIHQAVYHMCKYKY